MSKNFLFSSLFLLSMPTYAYIGPGMGGGLILAIIGFVLAFFLALWGVIYYPIKRSLRNRKEKRTLSKKSINHSE